MSKPDNLPLSFKEGLRDSVPIGLGYLSVSFGFGIAAVGRGISALVAVIISLINLTSAGQVAGVAVIAASGTLAEMALTQLTINLRYALMGISLSQRLEPSFGIPHRLLAGFGITDEIFAVASSKDKPLRPGYMYGLILFPWICWSSGTLLGAVAGNILPVSLKDALGIAIFGMFIAIVIPASKRERGVAVAASASAAVACAIAFVPVFSSITEGFRVIISALLAAAAAAALFPRVEFDGDENDARERVQGPSKTERSGTDTSGQTASSDKPERSLNPEVSGGHSALPAERSAAPSALAAAVTGTVAGTVDEVAGKEKRG